MNTSRFKGFILTALFLSLLSGCGYTTRAVLPSGERTIHVDNFVSTINVTAETSNRKAYYAYRPGMEVDITTAIIDQFIFDGSYQIKDAQNADFLMKGQLIDFKREPLRFDRNNNVTEYRLNVVANIEFYNRETGDLLWKESNFAGESTYRLRGQYAKAENTAAEEAIQDLARRAMERTVENW